MNYSCFSFHVGNKLRLKPGRNTDGIFEGASLPIPFSSIYGHTTYQVHNKYHKWRELAAHKNIDKNTITVTQHGKNDERYLPEIPGIPSSFIHCPSDLAASQ